ncbi:MAG: GNAT family N-acetyltransferase [Acidimicrobiia bacterium]|nr:GNAT family N-acetyltransferase [Acidimicrobiia bacterium]
MELKGERILLREFVDADVGALLRIHADSRVLRYYALELATREHARMLVDRFINWANENPRDNFQLAIVDPGAKSLLGSCGVRRKGCRDGQAEFGIGIDANWWGRGVASEAAKLILRFGFTELDLREIRGVAVSENEAVKKFAGRLGFVSGVPRQGEPWMLERGWSATDWVMTCEMWEKQAG